MNIAKKMFPALFDIIAMAHQHMQRGHNIYHVIAATNLTYRIALEEIALGETAGDEEVASAVLGCTLHNTDRELEQKLGRKPTDDEVRQLLMVRLAPINVSDKSKKYSVEAVLEHAGPNKSTHTLVTKWVRDGDRCANMMLNLVIRSGQRYPELQDVDFVHFLSDPEATYNEPRSVLFDIAASTDDWVLPESKFCVQTEAGKRLAAELVEPLRQYIKTLKRQLEWAGLLGS